MSEPFDLLIRGATIFDGTGAPPVSGDLGVRGERIAAVGELGPEARGGVEVNAQGLALAPGFIDVHTHDDFAVVLEPEMDFKLMQGVTTDVVGNCGMGAAPFAQARVFAAAVHPGRELEEWKGYRGYLAALDADPASLNVAVLVGHGTVRAAAMGGERRGPSADELSHMQGDVAEGIEGGAVGFSTGLIYEPGRNAQTDEIVELASVLRGSGALYATHMRDEAAGLLEAVRESLEIGRRAGVPVQISHHKVTGKRNWGLVGESLALIDAAREAGLDATADQYPYTAGSTVLAAVLQNAPGGDGEGGLARDSWEEVVIASSPGHPEWEGQSLLALAKAWDLPPLAAARKALEAEPAAWVVLHSMSEEDVRCVMRHPTTMIGSDGVPTGGKPHPRLYGTFARVLGHYARREGVLSMADAVYRMTGFAAQKFRLADRGCLREGAFADLVVFDPERIDDVSSYLEPRRHPEGIQHVFVNGRAVVRDGRHTGARPGHALRRG